MRGYFLKKRKGGKSTAKARVIGSMTAVCQGGGTKGFFLPLPWAACLLGSSSFDGSVNNPDKSERD